MKKYTIVRTVEVEYYQEIGAKNLKEAKEKIKEFEEYGYPLEEHYQWVGILSVELMTEKEANFPNGGGKRISIK